MKTNMLDRIKAAYERDMQSGHVAVLDTELPLSFESITDEWLTNVLCKAHPSARVMAHRLSEVNNGSSNRRKIYLEYNAEGRAAGLPVAVFCKATHGLENRILLGMGGGARCEVVFYRDIRPHLNIEAPRCFYAHMDHESFNSMIMLNDLTDEVTEFCTDKTPISRARAESQIALLAEFHGRCYASPQLQELLQQYLHWSDYFRNTETFGMKEGSNAGFLAAESVIPARLYRRSDEIWPATLASLRIHEQGPYTLAHGDVHLKNWYVAGNGGMGLSDWQCCGRGHWGRDLAYTISTSLTTEDRRAWERELVQLYLAQLHAAGGPEVSFDEGWTIYRQQLMTALTWWTVTLTPPPGLPDMQPRDTTLEFIRRIATAMDDLDSLDSFK